MHPNDDPFFALGDEYQHELTVLATKWLAQTATADERARFVELFHIVYPDGDLNEFLYRFNQAMRDDEQ